MILCVVFHIVGSYTPKLFIYLVNTNQLPYFEYNKATFPDGVGAYQ